MSGEDREGEATVERDDDGEPRGSAASSGRAAETFLDLEAELAADETAAGAGGDRLRGLVVDAETVPAGAVPDSYPGDVTAGEALALRVDLGDRTTVAYLDWPGREGVDPESALGRLLAALGVPADSFADLYGVPVLLEREAGHHTVFVPPEPPQGTGNWVLGVAGGLAFNAAVAGLVALGAAGLAVGGLLSVLVVPFLLVNFLAVPYATYRDATYVRTHSDWGQGPLFWATLSTVPGLNVLVGLLYLRSRSRARFLDSEPSLATRLVRVVRGLL